MSSLALKHSAGNAPKVQPIARSISQGLHRTAQPLTVLQGLLEQALLDVRTAEEYRGLMERLMEQARRVVSCFDHVRELVHLQDSAPAITDISASALVGAALESAQTSIASFGIRLQLHSLPNQVDDTVRVSEVRVQTALGIILENLASSLTSEARLTIFLRRDRRHVFVTVESHNDNDGPGKPSNKGFSTSSALELARAMVTSCGCEFTLHEPSSSVLLSLPRAPEDSRRHRTVRTEHLHV